MNTYHAPTPEALTAQVASLQAALSDACLIIDSLKDRLEASTKAYALLAGHRDRLAEALIIIADTGAQNRPLAPDAIARLALGGGK